jgi:hypothetical protein
MPVHRIIDLTGGAFTPDADSASLGTKPAPVDLVTPIVGKLIGADIVWSLSFRNSAKRNSVVIANTGITFAGELVVERGGDVVEYKAQAGVTAFPMKQQVLEPDVVPLRKAWVVLSALSAVPGGGLTWLWVSWDEIPREGS